jgi:hypothetical protein
MEQDYWEEDIKVNPAQMAYMLLQAKNKYVIYSRGTGKSFIVGSDVDENVRTMPRGITSLTQATIGQALTKTLPSTFKMLEQLGYKKYDYNTHTGDYVICQKPPDGFYQPYEHIMSYEHCITFANGHCLYILTQEGNSRGPSVDYNITDEALTLNKDKFDQEVAPTNRGNEFIFGKRSKHPVLKHHGNAFFSSMPYTPQQKWLLEPAKYYEEERGIHLFEIWNKIVNLQMQLIQSKIDNDITKFRDIWNECARLRKTITPFVSKDKTLFILGSIFDNIQNVGLSYIMNQYKVMDKLSFMIEILNYMVDRVANCYYKLDDRHIYYNATNDSFIKDFAENNDYNMRELARDNDCRRDLDCDPRQPLEICTDWGSSASFLSVGQPRNYDFVTHEVSLFPVFDIINEFYAQRNEEDDTLVNALCDKFAAYYANHLTRHIIYYRDRYGDVRHANAKKSYNEMFIDRLTSRYGWTVEPRVHGGIEPPQHDKFLLWMQLLAETDARYPHIRINGDKCKYTLISMNNTSVITDPQTGKFTKDKRSERNSTISPLEATHFGDCVDKMIWTKYGSLLNGTHSFIDVRI